MLRTINISVAELQYLLQLFYYCVLCKVLVLFSEVHG